MKAKVIRIGNSQGIRLPKVILNQTGIIDEVNLEVDGNRIILRPIENCRSGWRQAFQKMAQNSDDYLIDGNATLSQSLWQDKEWSWNTE